jgi:hypothetical protein
LKIPVVFVLCVYFNSLTLKLHRLSNKKREFSGIAHAKSGSSKQIKEILEIK